MKQMLFNFFFRKLIPFSWIDGHKTEIATFASFVSAVLLLVARYFPQYAPIVDQSTLVISTLLGLVGIEIGKMDKEVKSGGK